MLSDCHSHIDQFDAMELPDIFRRARAAAVTTIVAAGTTLASSAECIGLAKAHDGIYAAVGIHPTELAAPVDAATIDRLRHLALSHPKVVAISETGLDFAPGAPPSDWQHDAFRQQLRLARELGLPAIFHTREASAETLRMLREEKAQEVGAVWHYFQGDERAAQECLELGLFISLGRPLTRSSQLREVVRRLPLECLLLESDSFPQPYKKRREDWTEPRHVREVASTLAGLKGTTLAEVAAITTANLKRLAPGLR